MKRGRGKRNDLSSEKTLKNLLAIVLLLIIFVSLVGTILVTTSVKEISQATRAAKAQSFSSPSPTGAVVGVAIVNPTTDQEGRGDVGE